jgi:hypothetical protein
MRLKVHGGAVLKGFDTGIEAKSKQSAKKHWQKNGSIFYPTFFCLHSAVR